MWKKLIGGNSRVLSFVTRSPRTEEDFLSVFADTEAIKNTFGKFGSTCPDLTRLKEGNRQVLGTFEKMYPAKGQGSFAYRMAETTHEAWLELEATKAGFVRYTQELHNMISEYVEAGVICFTDEDRDMIALSLDKYEQWDKKYKIKKNNLRFASTDQKVEFYRRFLHVTGKAFDENTVINTCYNNYSALINIRPRTKLEEWSSRRPQFLYGLQADSVAAVFAAFKNREIMQDLASNINNKQQQAIIEILRRINLGWRANNTDNGTERYKFEAPFDFNAAKDGTQFEGRNGVGLEDITRDFVGFRAIMNILHKGIVEEGLQFDSGLCYDPSLRQSRLAEYIRRAYENGITGVMSCLLRNDKAILIKAVIQNVDKYRAEAEKNRLALVTGYNTGNTVAFQADGTNG